MDGCADRRLGGNSPNGKPVEVQALWYNALKIFSELLKLNNQEHDSFVVNLSAEKAKTNFNRQYWFEKGNYLYDVIDENGNPDADAPAQPIVCNQPALCIN
jgi:glycogen debranching enzyme